MKADASVEVRVALARLDERVCQFHNMRREDQQRLSQEFAKAERSAGEKVELARDEIARRLELIAGDVKSVSVRVDALKADDDVRRGREWLGSYVAPAIVAGVVTWLIRLIP